MEEPSEALRWAVEHYFRQRVEDARKAEALTLDERVAHLAVEAAKRHRDEV
ncbi:hypothetical protein ACWCPJ_38615 [Streptomyces collinus]